jgi:hypothetical protein
MLARLLASLAALALRSGENHGQIPLPRVLWAIPPGRRPYGPRTLIARLLASLAARRLANSRQATTSFGGRRWLALHKTDFCPSNLLIPARGPHPRASRFAPRLFAAAGTDELLPNQHVALHLLMERRTEIRAVVGKDARPIRGEGHVLGLTRINHQVDVVSIDTQAV